VKAVAVLPRHSAPACSVCEQSSDLSDRPTSSAFSLLMCGLCGAQIAVATDPGLRCDTCGERISPAASGVKLCDGTIVHADCEARPGTF
jgi:hypothetical protein